MLLATIEIGTNLLIAIIIVAVCFVMAFGKD